FATETDTVSVVAADDDLGGTDATDSDSATVTLDDVAPSTTVTKPAGDAADGADFHVDEPGGSVTFHVTVHNGSVSSDPVTLPTPTQHRPRTPTLARQRAI